LDKDEIEQVALLGYIILRFVVLAHREKIHHSPRFAIGGPEEIHDVPSCSSGLAPGDQPFRHDLGPARRSGCLLGSFTPFH
jgi:hypothetical protein